MDQQQHMTKTEAHPYHHGRGVKVYDPNCPLCREGHEPECGTYVSWSMYEKVMQESERRRVKISAMLAVIEAAEALKNAWDEMDKKNGKYDEPPEVVAVRTALAAFREVRE